MGSVGSRVLRGGVANRGEGRLSPKVSSSFFFFFRTTAEIKGDIFTATEIENHWTHGGR